MERIYRPVLWVAFILLPAICISLVILRSLDGMVLLMLIFWFIAGLWLSETPSEKSQD